jgi:hypothetical protein
MAIANLIALLLSIVVLILAQGISPLTMVSSLQVNDQVLGWQTEYAGIVPCTQTEATQGVRAGPG